MDIANESQHPTQSQGGDIGGVDGGDKKCRKVDVLPVYMRTQLGQQKQYGKNILSEVTSSREDKQGGHWWRAMSEAKGMWIYEHQTHMDTYQ